MERERQINAEIMQEIIVKDKKISEYTAWFDDIMMDIKIKKSKYETIKKFFGLWSTQKKVDASEIIHETLPAGFYREWQVDEVRLSRKANLYYEIGEISDWAPKVKTAEEMRGFGYIIEGKKVYEKPYVTIVLDGVDNITKTFLTLELAKEYAQSFKDLVPWIKIKY